MIYEAMHGPHRSFNRMLMEYDVMIIESHRCLGFPLGQ